MTWIPRWAVIQIAKSRTPTYSLRADPAHNVYTDCPVCVFVEFICARDPIMIVEGLGLTRIRTEARR